MLTVWLHDESLASTMCTIWLAESCHFISDSCGRDTLKRQWRIYAACGRSARRRTTGSPYRPFTPTPTLRYASFIHKSSNLGKCSKKLFNLCQMQWVNLSSGWKVHFAANCGNVSLDLLETYPEKKKRAGVHRNNGLSIHMFYGIKPLWIVFCVYRQWSIDVFFSLLQSLLVCASSSQHGSTQHQPE